MRHLINYNYTPEQKDYFRTHLEENIAKYPGRYMIVEGSTDEDGLTIIIFKSKKNAEDVLRELHEGRAPYYADIIPNQIPKKGAHEIYQALVERHNQLRSTRCPSRPKR